jgi:hypothetical protein
MEQGDVTGVESHVCRGAGVDNPISDGGGGGVQSHGAKIIS